MGAWNDNKWTMRKEKGNKIIRCRSDVETAARKEGTQGRQNANKTVQGRGGDADEKSDMGKYKCHGRDGGGTR